MLRKRLIQFLYVIPIFLMLYSCSESLFIKPEGSINSGVIFYFFDSLEKTKPKKMNIRMLAVQTQRLDTNWEIVWEIYGSAKTNKIVYGVVDEGLVEAKKSEPLAKNIGVRSLHLTK